MERLKGILLITICSIFWGATGPILQWFLSDIKMTTSFLLAVRLVIGGAGFLAILSLLKFDIWKVWKNKTTAIQLIVFSVIGMAGLSITFVKTIEVSNAVMATLVQFLSPIFILIYCASFLKQMPSRAQVIGITGTLGALFLLLTNGSMSSLEVNTATLIWGVALGLSYAFYTLYPARLKKQTGVLVIIAWGMFLSGSVIAIFAQIWLSNDWVLLTNSKTISMMFILIVLSSLSFVLYLCSMNYISPVETNILSSIEPLAAMIISFMWFGTYLKPVQLIGACLMLIFIAYISIDGERKKLK